MSINPSLENTEKVGSYVGRAGLGAAGALVWLALGLGAVVSASGAAADPNLYPFGEPSMRGTDKWPSPDFVKAYMHNGVFKSLKDVVHFYNKRNIAVDAAGKEMAFDLRKGPPAGYTALFPPPEVLENVQNVAGVTPAQATSATESNGQVGNLQLSSQQEYDLVNFLKILNDGYTKSNPVSP
jgi:cytochrome c peroxidase